MNDDTAPATKADVKLLMDAIEKLYGFNQRDHQHTANENWGDQLLAAHERWKTEIIQHFDLVMDQLRHHILSALREFTEQMHDRANNHETRIRRLEAHTGIGA